MNGAMMLLKSMGLDPDEITKQVDSAKVQVVKTAQHFDNKLSDIAKQNDVIIEQNKAIIDILKGNVGWKQTQ